MSKNTQGAEVKIELFRFKKTGRRKYDNKREKLEKFGKLLPMNNIMYYINVNFKVGRQLVHKAGVKLLEVAEVVVWCSIYLSLPHLPIAKKDYKSRIAIG